MQVWCISVIMPGRLESERFLAGLKEANQLSIPEREERNNEGWLRLFIEVFELHLEPQGDADKSLWLEQIARLTQILQNEEETNLLVDAMSCVFERGRLTSREKDVLRIRYNLDNPGATGTPSLDDIKLQFGVNKQRIGNIISGAMLKLMHQGTREPIYGFLKNRASQSQYIDRK